MTNLTRRSQARGRPVWAGKDQRTEEPKLQILVLLSFGSWNFTAGRSSISKDFFRRVPSASAENASARVAGSAAQIKAADGRAVVGPAGDRPHGEQRKRRHRALHDVATGQPQQALQIERTQ